MVGGSQPLQVGDLVKFRTWHDADNDWVILDDAGVWSVVAIETIDPAFENTHQTRGKFNNNMVTILGPYGIAEVMSSYLIRLDEKHD